MLVRVDDDDAVLVLHRVEAVGVEDGAHGDVPRLVGDLRGDLDLLVRSTPTALAGRLALHIARRDDRAVREGRERREHVGDRRIFPGDRDTLLLRALWFALER